MKLRLWNWISELLSRRVILHEDIVVLLGEKPQPSMLQAVVSARSIWDDEPFLKKFGALLRRRWEPDQDVVQAAAKRAFLYEVFGGEEDLGEELFDLMAFHSRQEWDFSSLTTQDSIRATALGAFTVATRQRLRDVASVPPLNLQLVSRTPLIATLVFPMIVKVPVVSLRWFLEIHPHFAFNEIRQSGHPCSDDLISFLYEILFLQQKTAIALSEYLRLAAYTGTQKGEAALINAEVDAIMGADLVFSYLKASVEKTMALVGLTHGIPNLDSKKDHKARLRALETNVPKDIQEQGYYHFIMKFVKSENLEELNAYRSGLLHKRGIADLQPHNYVGIEASALPFRKIYTVLHEQHAKNTAVLLASLALLTDDLVRRSPPSVNPEFETVGSLAVATVTKWMSGSEREVGE